MALKKNSGAYVFSLFPNKAKIVHAHKVSVAFNLIIAM